MIYFFMLYICIFFFTNNIDTFFFIDHACHCIIIMFVGSWYVWGMLCADDRKLY